MPTVPSGAFLDWYRDGTTNLYSQPPLNEILSWDDSRLEQIHNYIQWVFPLPELSMFAWAAPVVDREIFETFRNDVRLREQMDRAYQRIARFYGFELPATGTAALKIAFESPSQRSWVRRMDHNHLRITRILRSLRVLGLEEQANCFFSGLLAVNDKFTGHIGPRSIMYWTRAAQRPLYMEPDDEREDTGRGTRFLVQWEALHNPTCKAGVGAQKGAGT
jgi:Opioid growth factor receptor (OGFr) conserved region